VLIDTHCHLTHSRYDEDRTAVLERAHAAGVTGVVTIASDLLDAEAAAQLAAGHGGATAGGRGSARMWSTAGVHPHQAGEAPEQLEARLEGFLDGHPEVVAVGECGLDFHYDFSPRPRQREVFRTQLQVAARRRLPLVVHCREAEAEMVDWVQEAAGMGVRGVLHCYPGDLDLLKVAMDAGWFVSFTGLVTFRSFEGLEAVRSVPGDRYMLETDGPYMAPVPHRGRRNEPAWVVPIRDRIAEVRGESSELVGRATTQNARRFFGLELSALTPDP
jgi:TatD DNase family protein